MSRRQAKGLSTAIVITNGTSAASISLRYPPQKRRLREHEVALSPVLDAYDRHTGGSGSSGTVVWECAER